jgi:hypothetical protein
VIDLYRKHYTELQFERAGLFGLVQQSFHSHQVLYPGCFMHITPSLYFPHVVYIDRRPEVQTFFADLEGVSQFIERNKYYRRSAYIRFIAQDFTDPLPLLPDSFDLLISIFVTGAAEACQRYLKPNGLLLTNRRQEGTSIDFKLLYAVVFRSGKYRIVDGEHAKQLAARSDSKRTSHDLRQGERGFQYNENEIYFLFNKMRTHGLGS